MKKVICDSCRQEYDGESKYEINERFSIDGIHPVNVHVKATPDSDDDDFEGDDICPKCLRESAIKCLGLIDGV
jgi:protein-arginine kinase activator protein McsA